MEPDHIVAHHFEVDINESEMDILIVYDLPLCLAIKFAIAKYPTHPISYIETTNLNHTS